MSYDKFGHLLQATGAGRLGSNGMGRNSPGLNTRYAQKLVCYLFLDTNVKFIQICHWLFSRVKAINQMLATTQGNTCSSQQASCQLSSLT